MSDRKPSWGRNVLGALLGFPVAEERPRPPVMPTSEFNRALATAFNFYEGISRTRERTPIPFGIYDSFSESTEWTRLEFVSVTRHLYANDGLTRGLVNDIARYTVGGGLTPLPASGNPDWDAAALKYWTDWCARADFYGLHHFNALQRIWQVCETRDGDVGIILTDDGTGDPRVQTVRGHRIGSFGTGALGSFGIDYPDLGLIDGVQTDDFMRVLAYRVAYGKGSGMIPGMAFMPKVWRDIPARAFVLYYEPDEPDALRGLTPLRSSILHFRDKKDTVGFEKVAVKNLSIWPAVLKTESGTVEDGEWEDDPDAVAGATKLTRAQMQAGQIPVIGKNESLDVFEGNRPSPAFTGFLEFIIREICHGVGLPYEFVWNPEKIGGANTRFVMEKAQRRFVERQENFKRRVLNRVWGYVIANAIARERLADNPNKFDVGWQVPQTISVDAGRDAAQDRADVVMGLMPVAEHYGQRGLDWRKAREQIETEVDDLLTRADKMAKKWKIKLESALTLFEQTSPNAVVPAAPVEPGTDGQQPPPAQPEATPFTRPPPPEPKKKPEPAKK